MNFIRPIAVTTIVVAVGSLTVSLAQAPTQNPARVWTKTDSLAYARDQIEIFAEKQFACLANLWGKESAWNPTALDKVRVMGLRAGGIPQLLGMTTTTPPPYQIDRGLTYIYYRYGTPCNAWAHWQRKWWY